jgi:hypothetical protein
VRKPRKLWSVRFPHIPAARRHRPESKVSAYRYVRAYAANWDRGALRSPIVNVEVDERDGRGWRLYEQVDLRTYGAWPEADTDEC